MKSKNDLKFVRNISIGMVAGVLAIGVPTLVASKIFSEGTVKLPFVIDKEMGYEVTSQNFHIDRMKTGKNEVEVYKPQRQYMNEEDIKKLPKVSFKTTSPYSENKIISLTNMSREINAYEYEESSVTDKEIEDIINQFEKGNFKDISNNCDYESIDFEKADYLLEEDLENKSYSADLTIYEVNYDKKHLINESEESNSTTSATFTIVSLISAMIGGRIAFSNEVKYSKNDEKILKKC